MSKDEFVRYTIRVPADLYERVQKAAGMKSVNAEIVEALRQLYPAPLNPFDEAMSEIDKALLEAETDETKREFLRQLLVRIDSELKKRTPKPFPGTEKRKRLINLDDPEPEAETTGRRPMPPPPTTKRKLIVRKPKR